MCESSVNQHILFLKVVRSWRERTHTQKEEEVKRNDKNNKFVEKKKSTASGDDGDEGKKWELCIFLN